MNDKLRKFEEQLFQGVNHGININITEEPKEFQSINFKDGNMKVKDTRKTCKFFPNCHFGKRCN